MKPERKKVYITLAEARRLALQQVKDMDALRFGTVEDNRPGCAARGDISTMIDAIPAWRRWLICRLNRKKWKIAQAFSIAAVNSMDDDELFATLLRRSDAAWAELYGIQQQPCQCGKNPANSCSCPN